MTWSFIGSVSTVNVNGTTAATMSLPASVQGGDIIVASWCFYNTTITVAGFTTDKNLAGSQGAKDAFWTGHRSAAGARGSATSDTTFSVTFGANTWGECVLGVWRTTVGVGAVTSAEYNTSAGYVTACPDPTGLTPGASDLAVWGYAGQNAAVGGAGTTFSGTGPTALTNFVQQQFASNGGGIGQGWKTGPGAPGGATASQAVDPTDFLVSVTEQAPSTAQGASWVQRGGRTFGRRYQKIQQAAPAMVALPVPPPPLVTTTSAKALQRCSADKIAYLFDGSAVIGWWTGTAGQVAQVTSPLTTPVLANLITTVDDGISLWADNSAGTSSDLWVASSSDDGASSGTAAIKIRHASYNGSTFTWDTATVVPGATSPNTISCSVTWNGTYLMVFWWDGVSGTDRVSYAYTTTKNGTGGWTSGGTFSESGTWSTIVQVTARHSTNLAATVVAYNGNSQMHYAVLKDSAATPALANWGGRAVFDQFSDSGLTFSGPQLVIDEATGTIHLARSCPNKGGPTWFGVTYWKGTYSSVSVGSVSWATRVIVDATGGPDTPADIAVAVDTAGTVYVVWTTDLASDAMKWATLVSPYTSAVAGGTIPVASANPRWPHVPAVSPAQAGLSGGKLPVLYMDLTGSPYPLTLDTSIPVAGATVTGTAAAAGSGSVTAAGGVTSPLVQSKQGKGTASPLTITLDAPTTAGNGLVVMVSASGTTANGTVSGITLGGSADHFASAASAGGSTDASVTACWLDLNCAGGQTSVVITFTGGSGAAQEFFAAVYERNDLATSAAFDKSSGNISTVAWTSNATATLSQASEVAVGAVFITGSSQPTITGPGAPWANLTVQTATQGSFLDAWMSGWKTVSTTAAVTFAGTSTNGTDGTALVVTLKAAGGAATGTAAAAGAGQVTAVATQAATAAAAGAGSVTAAATVIAAGTAAGAATAAAKATQIAPGSASGAASVTAVPATQIAGGTAAGAGSAAAAVTQAAAGSGAGAAAATAVATQAAGATAAAAGSVSDVATQAATATAAGAGSVTAAGSVSGVSSGTASIAGAAATTAVVTQAAPAAGAGTAAVTAAAAQAAGGSAAGAGSAAAKATQIAPATAASVGAAAGVVTQIAAASAAGAGSVTAAGSVSGQSTGAAAGAAAVTAAVTQAAPGSAAGAGAVTAAAAQAAKASAAGAGAVTGAATQIAGAAIAGAGQVTAAGSVIGAGATASAAGAGAVSAIVTQAATASAAGAGSVSDVATQSAKATAAGAGAVTAAGYITGTASVAGAGTTAAKAVQAVAATAAAAAALSALATQRATAALAAAGAVTATGTSTAPVTYGTARQGTSVIPRADSGTSPAAAAQAGNGTTPRASQGTTAPGQILDETGQPVTDEAGQLLLDETGVTPYARAAQEPAPRALQGTYP